MTVNTSILHRANPFNSEDTEIMLTLKVIGPLVEDLASSARAIEAAVNAHLEKSIKTNETSLAAPLANLEILARVLGVISQQQLDGTERIVRSLQELTAALAAGSTITEAMATPQNTPPVNSASPKSAMISRLLRYVASYGESNQTTATPEKVYADMVRDGSFDIEAGLTFAQLVNTAIFRGLIRSVAMAAPNDGRYLQLSV